MGKKGNPDVSILEGRDGKKRAHLVFFRDAKGGKGKKGICSARKRERVLAY